MALIDNHNEQQRPGFSHSVESLSDCSVKTGSSPPKTKPDVQDKTIMIQSFMECGPWQQEYWNDLPRCTTQYSGHSFPLALSGSSKDCHTQLMFATCRYSPVSGSEPNSVLSYTGQWAYEATDKIAKVISTTTGQKSMDGRKSHQPLPDTEGSSVRKSRTKVSGSDNAGTILAIHRRAGSSLSDAASAAADSTDHDTMMRDLGSGLEPDLDADATTVDETILDSHVHVSSDLRSLAHAVFSFWPAGVHLYNTHTYALGQALTSGQVAAPRNNSVGGPKETSNSSGNAQKPTRFGRDSSGDHNVQLARGHKQNAAAGIIVMEWRCIHEAGLGDLSCDKYHSTLFSSMIRHMKIRHPSQYPRDVLEQHIKDLGPTHKQSSDKAREQFAVSLFAAVYPGRAPPYLRFNRMKDGTREPIYPSTVLGPSFADELSNGVRSTDVHFADSSSTGQPSALPPIPESSLQNPGGESVDASTKFVDSSYTVDSTRRTPETSTTETATAQTTAAHAFAADMKNDPLLAIRVEAVLAELENTKWRANREQQSLEFQSNGKRKMLETEDDDLDQRARLRRRQQVDDEEFAEQEKIHGRLQAGLRHAERAMQELYDLRTRGESSSRPMKIPTPQTGSSNSFGNDTFFVGSGAVDAAIEDPMWSPNDFPWPQ